MGSQAIQGQLWGQQPQNWATIQEQTGQAGYEYVLSHFSLAPTDKLLDVGCGTGLFSRLAAATGADITGIDASAPLIAEAQRRSPAVRYSTGEMEELPFGDNAFDFVTGFNSFQYAANVPNALSEAQRVLKKGGKLAVMIWGNKEDCEAATYLKAVGILLPPPPPGAPGPFALSEDQRLEKIIEEAGLKIVNKDDVISIWEYPDVETAIKGLMSAGPVARAIDHTGFDTVHSTILAAVQPYIQANGHVVYNNKIRIVIAEKH